MPALSSPASAPAGRRRRRLRQCHSDAGAARWGEGLGAQLLVGCRPPLLVLRGRRDSDAAHVVVDRLGAVLRLHVITIGAPLRVNRMTNIETWSRRFI